MTTTIVCKSAIWSIDGTFFPVSRYRPFQRGWLMAHTLMLVWQSKHLTKMTRDKAGIVFLQKTHLSDFYVKLKMMGFNQSFLIIADGLWQRWYQRGLILIYTLKLKTQREDIFWWGEDWRWLFFNLHESPAAKCAFLEKFFVLKLTEATG